MDRDCKGHVTKQDYLHLATTNPEAIKKLGLGARSGAAGPGQRKRSQLAHKSLAHEVVRGGEVRRRSRRRQRGTTVTFGHANWEQVVQMMTGIRLAIGNALREASASLKSMERAAAASGGGACGSEEEQPAAGKSSPALLPLTHDMYTASWKTQSEQPPTRCPTSRDARRRVMAVACFRGSRSPTTL